MWVIALHGLLFLCGKGKVKISNAGLGVVILIWVLYERFAHSVQLSLLQTSAAPGTGRQMSSLISGEIQGRMQRLIVSRI